MDNIMYTIGACSIYDPQLDDDDFSKRWGGTVWKTLDAVLMYYKSINGRLFTYDDEKPDEPDKEEPAGIYLVSGDWLSDVNYETKDRGSLKRSRKIIKKIEI